MTGAASDPRAVSTQELDARERGSIAAAGAERPVDEASARPRPGLRILHVLDHSLPLHSGYSFRSISLFREQRRLGWEPVLLTSPKQGTVSAEREEIEGFPVYRTRAAPAYLRDRPLLAEVALIGATARRIRAVASLERPQLLHAHSPVLNALACLLASRWLRLPVVYEIRGFWEDAAVSHGTTREGSLRYRASRAMETFAAQRSDAVVTICEGIRRDLRDRGIEDGKITLVPNGVDPAEFAVPQGKDAALSASLELDGKIVLGFLGSFYDYEGLDLLLSATQRILKQVPQLVVLLAGGGPEDEALRRMASDLGIASSVRFVGRVPHREVPRYYSLVDLFLYPRRSMRLTESVTPLKPLEAMARGGIVLASNVGGHRELLADGATGYLFEPGDVDALAKAVLRTLERRSEWGAIGRRARAFVEAERSWACCTAGYRNAYHAALAGHEGQV